VRFGGASFRFAVTVLLLVALFGYTGGLCAQDAVRYESLELVTSTGTYKFEVEIAATPEQHMHGLMFRRSIGTRKGMLFIYDKPQYVSMWMRNTYISLDMIFIRADGRVHRVEASTEPLSERIIESGDRVNAILEVAGGTAAMLHLKPGDIVRHSHFKSP
jgi:uncharacterized membrane protein (UPF0127 family)